MGEKIWIESGHRFGKNHQNAMEILTIAKHGAPGSQNGWNHSGRQGVVQWGIGDTINRTMHVIDLLSQKIAALDQNPSTSNTVVALELLNEAFPPFVQGGVETVKQYYKQAYYVARRHLNAERYWIVIEMAFTINWGGFMSEPEYKNVILDMHLYQCFEAGLRAMTSTQHLQFAW